jgi:tetratricopeptide (TPR) repeat protein
MASFFPPHRFWLLAAALLSACAAGDNMDRPALRGAAPEVTGAFGSYLAGRFATNEADTKYAADSLIQALRLDPSEPEVVQRAFIAALLDGRADAARLARVIPNEPLAAMLLAGQDAQAGRYDRAEQRFRALPRQGLSAVLQPLLLAWAQQGRGQTDAALATLRPLTETGRQRGIYALHGAMIADIADRPREAERLVRIALADSATPSLPLTRTMAGILMRAGQTAEAERLLDRLGRGHDDAGVFAETGGREALATRRVVASATEGMAEAYLALATALRGPQAGEFSLALVRLALQLRPRYGPALLAGADALSDEGQYAAALALLERGDRADPFAPLLALRRAGLLDRLNRVPEAEAELRRLATQFPRAFQPMARLGDLYRGRQNWPSAITAYDAAISKLGAPVVVHWPLFYARGIALERAKRWPEAEADFQRALSLNPEQPLVLNYLAYSWVELGQNLVEARRMLERAVELRPNDGNIADSLGWALYKLGDIPGAVRWLEKAVELESQSSVINDHLGDAYWAQGRRREALFQWRRALTLGPEGDEGPKIEAKVANGLAAQPSAETRR